MNPTPPTEPQDTLDDMLATYMTNIEDWESKIEGTPTKDDLLELDIIYDQTKEGMEQYFTWKHNADLDRVRAEAEAIIRKERPIFLRKGDSDPTGEETVAIRNQLRQEILNDFATLIKPKGDK